MSKARTLANLISDNAELADGQISVAEVVGAAPLASPTFTGTASGTFSGPLTGNVTGNLTGNVTGAVTGDVTAPEIDLTAIAATISDTAVDVFVYDTSKDSDGGAWRKRTQHTSWYNETLNTSTRGARKEFPAVAVIVAESNQVTIYDGDDPDLPMWMVFNSGSGTMIRNINGSCTALNANLVVGATDYDLFVVNFIKDNREQHYTSGTLTYNLNIAGRNVTGTGNTEVASGAIINRATNDVAITVLPNAPIDAATGLPVPTIAVATNTGLSVITDSGQVFDKTTTSGNIYSRLYKIAFLENNDLCYYHDRGYNKRNVLAVYPVSRYTTQDYSSFAQGGNRIWGSYPTAYPAGIGTNSNSSDSFSTITAHGNEIAAGKAIGLSVFDVQDTEDQSAVSYVTSSYNTGWQNGAIKLATLSDTSTTNVTGSELVTNGDGSTTTGWTAYSATLSSSSGAINVADNGGYSKAYQAITTVVGKRYTVTAEVTAVGGNNAVLSVGSNNPQAQSWGTQSGAIITVSPAILSATFTADATTMYVQLGSESSYTSSFKNISVRLAEQDRSVNGNGLQVFGTVTKNPVATGADLVGYSGFSASNLLIQPHNDDLDFGTGDFAVFAWMHYGTASQTNIIDYAEFNSSTGRFEYYLDSNKVIRVAVGTTYVSLGTASASGWSLFCVTRQNGLVKTYENGKEMGTTTSLSGSIGGSNHKLWVGTNYLGGGAAGGQKLSLLRVSTTVPSPEQIAKIYEDEKVLFQDGAQATLYGSSDAVTALAYDDSTELLHVGTSAGRSVFQGLRRVDNTTDAVGAAISASNGLVAED